MRILIVTPTFGDVRTGNRCTAADWRGLLSDLGHTVDVVPAFDGQDADLLIALHASHSHDSVQAFHAAYPDRPVVVALTGTDIYPDLRPDALDSLRVATRIVGLQPAVRERVPAALRHRVHIVVQSAAAPAPSHAPPRAGEAFQVAVVAHMRSVKDPVRAAAAVRLLPEDSRVRVVHAGAVIEPEYGEWAETETATNPRWRWIGEVTPSEARGLIAASDLLVLSSHAEGGGRVIGEAAAAGTPIVAARNDATTSLLGAGYPGLFEPGDTAALADLLQRAASDAAFRERLRERTLRVRALVAPERERASWAELLAELAAERAAAG